DDVRSSRRMSRPAGRRERFVHESAPGSITLVEKITRAGARALREGTAVQQFASASHARTTRGRGRPPRPAAQLAGPRGELGAGSRVAPALAGAGRSRRAADRAATAVGRATWEVLAAGLRS